VLGVVLALGGGPVWAAGPAPLDRQAQRVPVFGGPAPAWRFETVPAWSWTVADPSLSSLPPSALAPRPGGDAPVGEARPGPAGATAPVSRIPVAR
jgi:hypothetical protein